MVYLTSSSVYFGNSCASAPMPIFLCVISVVPFAYDRFSSKYSNKSLIQSAFNVIIVLLSKVGVKWKLKLKIKS